MRKKKLWKKQCALGMAIVLASGTTVTPALADNAVAQVDEAEKSTSETRKETSVSDDKTGDKTETDASKKEDVEKGDSESGNAEKEESGNESSGKDESEGGKEENENSGKDESGSGESGTESSGKDDSESGESGKDENGGEDSGKDGSEVEEGGTEDPDKKEEDKNSEAEDAEKNENEKTDSDEKIEDTETPDGDAAIEPGNGTTAGAGTVLEPLVPVQEEVPVLEELPEVKKIKLKGATIKVKPDMDLDDIEEALNEALVDEGEETPDQWYYETSLVIKKYWVQIEGDTLKLTGINTNFKSLKDYIEDGHKSVKIGINRKIKETLGNVISTSVEKSVSVDFVDSAKITKEGLSSHGREVAGKEIPKSVKFGSDISFAILPEDGYVPTVKYAVGDEDEGESKELEADEISKGEYSYTIDGDEVEDDIRITVSYSKTVARKVDIQTEGGTVSVNGREQKNSETVAVTKKNCEIKIQPQPGYAIESIQAGDDEIALNNQDFEKYAYIYKVDEDSVTADAEPLKLKVTVKKVELAAKAGTRQVQWLKGFSQPDDKLEDALKDAIIDVKKTYPDLEETDGEIKVEYLARDLGSLGKNYKELDYEPEGISGLGAHKFGENSKVDEEGNPIENVRISLVNSSRYPDAVVEADVVLKDTRELAKFTVNASSIRYTTDAD